MPPPELPDLEEALARGGGTVAVAELAECHGVACGLVCRQCDSQGTDFIALLDTLQLLTDTGGKLLSTMQELHRATRAQLADEQFRLALWLPGDEEPLEERTAALAQWCTGFLAGLGSGGPRTADLSDEAREALRDLEEIARAEVEGGISEEEEEEAFMQIIEYVRVAALLVREELRGPGPRERIH